MTSFDPQRQASPKDVLRVVWKRAWIVVLTVVVFVGAAVGFGLLQPPVYEASAKMLVGQDTGDGDSQSSLGSDIQGLQQITHTVTVAVASKPVAEDAIRQLDLRMDPQQLLDNLSVAQMGDSQFVELGYTDPDPELARAVVNAIGDTAGERISESSAAASAVNATMWEYAEVPEEPVGPNPLRDGLLALGLGLMLGIGLTLMAVRPTTRSPITAGSSGTRSGRTAGAAAASASGRRAYRSPLPGTWSSTTTSSPGTTTA